MNEMNEQHKNHGRIRSFVRREGRLSDRQQRALKQLWEKYGLAGDEKIPPAPGDITLEIGFGMGQSLLQMAKANPEKQYIGIEVHRPGIGALLAELEAQQITNVRVYAEDAVAILKNQIAPDSLSEVLIYFPDPWPKKRHHKRRLIQPEFIKLVLSRLKDNGMLHCATDWEDYAHHMMATLSASPDCTNTLGEGQFSTRPTWRPETKFENRGQHLGHAIYDLIFRKTPITPIGITPHV